MTKYKLNIKYPIRDENEGKLFADLYRFNGKYVFKIGNDSENNLYKILMKDDGGLSYERWCFKHWIEEIKEESPYDKWYHDNFKNDERLRNWTSESWKASQENRDLLYKELIKHCSHFIGLKENGGNCYELDRSILEIKRELEKIKDQLNQ